MTVFITGGTGFIGRHLLAHLTDEESRVLALMRDTGRLPQLRDRVEALGGHAAALESVHGDLSVPGMGIARELPPLRAVIHLGAAFAWGMPRALARRTNVDGALAAAALAHSHGARLVMISGFMLENRRHLQWLGVTDDVDTTDWNRVYARAGAYEASKIEAAVRVRAHAARNGIDLVEVQPATVSGHSASGELDPAQPLFGLIDNLASGRLALVPGTPQHWLPLISVDALSSLIATAARADQVPPRLLALDARTPDLRALLGMLAEAIGRPAPRRHIPMPLLRGLLRIPGMPRLMNTYPESLHFLQPERFDTSITTAFRQQHRLEWPPIDGSIRTTAAYWAGGAPGDTDPPDHGAYNTP